MALEGLNTGQVQVSQKRWHLVKVYEKSYAHNKVVMLYLGILVSYIHCVTEPLLDD